jgi:hypothetical protein
MLVSVRVASLRKVARIYGDRSWRKRRSGVEISEPASFERVPLRYEYAFGGWDRDATDASRHACEARNPVGIGFRARGARFEEGARLPNIEDPARPLTRYHGRGVPLGFGFIGPDWEPRRSFAGTYDEAWEREQSPLLPRDFDRRFFCAASSGLRAPEHLRGDEQVELFGVTVEQRLSFALPGIEAPRVCMSVHGTEDVALVTALDTVIIDSDARTLQLLWRAYWSLESPEDVSRIEVRCANAPARALRREHDDLAEVIPLRRGPSL